jgi:hypothetical protein
VFEEAFGRLGALCFCKEHRCFCVLSGTQKGGSFVVKKRASHSFRVLQGLFRACGERDCGGALFHFTNLAVASTPCGGRRRVVLPAGGYLINRERVVGGLLQPDGSGALCELGF